MKVLTLAVVSFILTLTVPAFGLTSDNPASPANSADKPYVAPNQAPVPSVTQTRGVIVQLDQVKETIRVRDGAGREGGFFVNTNTPMYDSLHRQLTFEDLHTGDLISISFSAADNSVIQIQKLKG